MIRHLSAYRVVAYLTLISFTLSAVQPLTASEPAKEFLQGLRDRGYFDTAVEYLQSLKTSPLAPVEMKELLTYELGATLIQASRDQRDLKTREKYLDEARDSLQRFVGMYPDHPLVTSANSQLGNLMVERARIKMEQTKRPGADVATLMSEANTIYSDAYKVFERAQADLKEKLAKMANVDPNDAKAVELRDQFRTDYLQAQLLGAAVKEEAADTTKAGSEEYKSLVAEAAKQYAEIYDKYRVRLAGLYARMYEGRCNQKLGKTKDALSLYNDLLAQPDNPEEFRTLKTKVLLLALECWEKDKLYAEAVAKLGPWIDGARPNEGKEPDWLKLRLALAKAQYAHAQSLKATNARDPNVKRLESDARKNAAFVARLPGDYQQDARKVQADIGVDIGDPTALPEPKTFDEARQAGRDALDAIQTANLVIKTLPARIAKETDAAVKADLQKQLEQAQQTVKSSTDDAKRYFRLALTMVDKSTDLRDVNIIRYFLCYLHYTAQEYYDAGLLGEFLARRYSDGTGAKDSAKIAMASFLQLYAQNQTADKQFESDRVISIAGYITQKWPDQPEAVDALNTLIPFMIKDGNLDAAEDYLKGIPETSPKRGDAEIKTGQAMWSAYLKGMAQVRKWESGEDPKPDTVDLAAEKTRLVELKTRAQKVLGDGITRMQAAGEASDAAATAALSLAQIYVDTEQAEKAVTLLEDAKLGPLTLVRANHPSTSREGFAGEVYKTSLRAYISSLPKTSDPDGVIKNATAVMDAMKQTIDPQKLIAMYVSLARDLEEQMKLASPATKAALSKGFETFLKRLRGGATDLGVLNWVAETFSGIAASFDTGKQLTAEAAQYYQEAADTYQTILDKATIDDPKLKTQIQLRLAMSKRRLAKFTEARDLFKTILAANPSMLNVQCEAAMMYQEWAGFPDKEALYFKAMAGSEPDAKKENIIWGWSKIATRSARFEQFRDVFHQGRYNLAKCFYLYGMAKSGKEKNDALVKGRDSILHTQKLYGSGPDWLAWRPKYDQLCKDFQKALNEKPVGLPADEVETAPAAKTPPAATAPASPAPAGTAPATTPAATTPAATTPAATTPAAKAPAATTPGATPAGKTPAPAAAPPAAAATAKP